ncbi:MAG: hypothetical protein AAGA54_24610 [Myxococcota bacterium]
MSEAASIAFALASAGWWHHRVHAGRLRLGATLASIACIVAAVVIGVADAHDPATPWVVAIAAWSASFTLVVVLRPFAPRWTDRGVWVATLVGLCAAVVQRAGTHV